MSNIYKWSVFPLTRLSQEIFDISAIHSVFNRPMAPGIHDKLTTQYSGSRAKWRKRRAILKLHSGFASFRQWTDCFPCDFFLWQPYSGSRPLKINLEGMHWGMWVESYLLICCQQDSMFESKIVIGHLGSCWRVLRGVLVIVHHGFGLRLSWAKLATKQVYIK